MEKRIRKEYQDSYNVKARILDLRYRNEIRNCLDTVRKLVFESKVPDNLIFVKNSILYPEDIWEDEDITEEPI